MADKKKLAEKVEQTQNGDILSNIITLRSVYGKTDIKIYVQPTRDPKTGAFPPCVKRVNSAGDMILTDAERNDPNAVFIPETQLFTIGDGTTYDLNNPYDAAEWEAIKNCVLIAPDRFATDSRGAYLIDGNDASNYFSKDDSRAYIRAARSGQAELYVDHPGALASHKVSRLEKVHDAVDFIKASSYDRLLAVVKVFGKDMSNMTTPDIKDYLYSIAEKTPEKIIEVYTDGDLHYRLLYIQAKETGVIYRKDGAFWYGEDKPVLLGASDAAVLRYLKDQKNAPVIAAIRKEAFPDMCSD